MKSKEFQRVTNRNDGQLDAIRRSLCLYCFYFFLCVTLPLRWHVLFIGRYAGTFVFSWLSRYAGMFFLLAATLEYVFFLLA
jgi:hypothetical protein